MRATLNADRSREHLEAHKLNNTVMLSHLRAEQVVEWATLGGPELWGWIISPAALLPARKPTWF
jgi:5-methylthioadenosine/S-adenosylhomocysteine deaminase